VRRVGVLVILLALGVAVLLYLRGSGDPVRETTPGESTSAERRETERLEAVLRGGRQSALSTVSIEPLHLDTDAFFYLRVLDSNGTVAPQVKLAYTVDRLARLRRGSVTGVAGWYALERAGLISPLNVLLVPKGKAADGTTLAPLPLRDVDYTQEILEVRLEEARVLRGLVVDSSGVAQPDVEVRAGCYGLHLSYHHSDGQLGTARTNDRGQFEFSGLPWLPIQLDLTTDIAFQRTMKVEVAARQEQCRIELPATRRLICRVHDPDGKPVEEAYLYVVAGVGEERWMAVGKTNAEGQGEVRGLRPGEELRLTIRKYKSPFQPYVLEIRDPDVEAVDAQLEIGVAIEGEVVLPPGCEAGEIHVLAIPSGPWNVAAWRSQRLLEGETRFRVEGLKPGPHEVTVALGKGEPDSAPFHVVAPASELRLQLKASREIHGAVTGFAAGNLFVIWTDGTHGWGMPPGKGGRFRFRIPADTDGVIYVHCDRNALHVLRPVGPADSGALKLRLEEGVRISGWVERTDGSRCPAAQVRIQAGRLRTSVRCDAEGNFTTFGLPKGVYEVAVVGSNAPAIQVRAPAEDVRIQGP